MINDLNLEYFPTRKEIATYYGDERLTNKVCKTLGYYGWAKELGMPVKDNDTKTGKLAEKYVAKLLESKGYKAEQMLQNYPYDLLVNDMIKVDVKFSHIYRHPQGFGFYSFKLGKEYPACDFYMLIAQDDKGKRTVYVVPAMFAPKTQISIGEYTSEYFRYIDRFDYFDKYCEIYKALEHDK